eukprot:COSAG06_NODE_55751_length_288_cov_0.798942_1_plen_34_part_10
MGLPGVDVSSTVGKRGVLDHHNKTTPRSQIAPPT